MDSLLDYCDRLADGRVIGRGLVEGACKNLVGRRLKQTGACWRLDRANKIARVCGLLYSHQWENAWKKMGITPLITLGTFLMENFTYCVQTAFHLETLWAGDTSKDENLLRWENFS